MPHFVVCVADIAIPQDKEQTQPIEEAKCCNHQCLPPNHRALPIGGEGQAKLSEQPQPCEQRKEGFLVIDPDLSLDTLEYEKPKTP